MAKKRLDLILFEHGFFETKSAASANILAHNVKINGEIVSKAGEMFDEAVYSFYLCANKHVHTYIYDHEH